MAQKGDQLEGDVIVTTHICPTAPTQPHKPVPFMGSPVSMATNVHITVDSAMDAVYLLTRQKGTVLLIREVLLFPPTVKEGYILHISEDLLQSCRRLQETTR